MERKLIQLLNKNLECMATRNRNWSNERTLGEQRQSRGKQKRNKEKTIIEYYRVRL